MPKSLHSRPLAEGRYDECEDDEDALLLHKVEEIDDTTAKNTCMFCSSNCPNGESCFTTPEGIDLFPHLYAIRDCNWFESAAERMERKWRNKIQHEYATRTGKSDSDAFFALIDITPEDEREESPNEAVLRALDQE